MTIWQPCFVPKVDEAIRSLERDGWRLARRGVAGQSGAGRDASVSDLHSLFVECGIRASTSVHHNYDYPPKMIDIERLIELVKQNEFLYDISHKDYKNPSLKTATWELIAKELNGTSEICKLKWKTVRDSYIKYKRLLMNSDGTKEIDYIWSSNLKFLDNHNVNRRSFYHTLSKQTKTNKRAAAESALKAREDLANEISSSPPPLERLGTLTMAEGSSASFQTNQDLLSNKGDPKTKFKEMDATDLLFLSYSATFKKFPARQQTFMKLELAKLFANAELQQLDDAEQCRVECAENFHVIIKREYVDKDESEISEFSDDVTRVKPAKLKRRDSVPEE